MILKKSKITPGRVFKTGFFTWLSADVAAFPFAFSATQLAISGRPKAALGLATGSGLVLIAVIAGILTGSVKRYKKQAKMILQVACDEWNKKYPYNKLTIKDIKDVIKGRNISAAVMKSTKQATKRQIEHAIEGDKIYFK